MKAAAVCSGITGMGIKNGFYHSRVSIQTRKDVVKIACSDAPKLHKDRGQIPVISA